jgi:hypothetical protein
VPPQSALLQHGAILLATSPFTPSLPGIEPLIERHLSPDQFGERFVAELTVSLGWEMTATDWEPVERTEIERLTEQKYRSTAWNEKR